MRKLLLEFNVEHPITNPDRNRQVLIFCRTADGRFIFGEKEDYLPQGVCRMLGGRLDEEEDPKKGAIRELAEETSVQLNENDLVDLAQIDVIQRIGRVEYPIHFSIYYIQLPPVDSLHAGDDISAIKILTLEEFKKMNNNLKNLTGYYNSVSKSRSVTFSWGDWGKIYNAINQVVIDWYELRENSLKTG